MKKYYLAIDLGATSGRHVLSYVDENNEIQMEEIHRFKTGVDESPKGFLWNIPRIYNEIVEGIKKGFAKTKDIVSLSIDSWGVDYVLLDKDDNPILPYYAYRNARTSNELIDKVHSIISFKELYEKTGIQFASFNTIYQLYADKEEGRLENAKGMLMLPEYFSFLLTGKKAREYSMASTTGLINLKTSEIDEEILNKLGLPSFVKEPLVKPGHILGDLSTKTQELVGGNCKVIMCASHDTASAYESIDTKPNSVLISSGTWSLLGIKSKTPISDEKAYKANFTNEAGPDYIRFLKNIMGMWIANSVATQLNVSIPEICKTLEAPDQSMVFDVNDQSLLNPTDMKKAVLALLPREPKSIKELFEAIYYSLAVCYKNAIAELEGITGSKYEYVYIIGGGANNKYLNGLVETVVGKKVIAMPIEATCLGNIKVQSKAN